MSLRMPSFDLVLASKCILQKAAHLWQAMDGKEDAAFLAFREGNRAGDLLVQAHYGSLTHFISPQHAVCHLPHRRLLADLTLL